MILLQKKVKHLQEMFIQSSIDRKHSRRREIYFTDHHNCQLEYLESISNKECTQPNEVLNCKYF